MSLQLVYLGYCTSRTASDLIPLFSNTHIRNADHIPKIMSWLLFWNSYAIMEIVSNELMLNSIMFTAIKLLLFYVYIDCKRMARYEYLVNNASWIQQQWSDGMLALIVRAFAWISNHYKTYINQTRKNH